MRDVWGSHLELLLPHLDQDKWRKMRHLEGTMSPLGPVTFDPHNGDQIWLKNTRSTLDLTTSSMLLPRFFKMSFYFYLF